MSITKPIVDDRSISVSIKPKANKAYIPHFKKNHKDKAYFAMLDEEKSSNVDIEVSKLIYKPIGKLQTKSIFVPTYHLCGIVGHIRPNCSLLRKKPKLEIY